MSAIDVNRESSSALDFRISRTSVCYLLAPVRCAPTLCVFAFPSVFSLRMLLLYGYAYPLNTRSGESRTGSQYGYCLAFAIQCFIAAPVFILRDSFGFYYNTAVQTAMSYEQDTLWTVECLYRESTCPADPQYAAIMNILIVIRSLLVFKS